MKTLIIVVMAFACMALTTVHAQNVVDKANNKVDKASATVDKAKATADEAGNTIKKIGGLFKKKKNKDNDASPDKGDYNTVINIKGISMASLKTLNANVQACKNVSATKMKFSGSGVSKIFVMHKGSTEDLLANIQKSSKNIFTDKNIENMDDGVVDISLGGTGDDE